MLLAEAAKPNTPDPREAQLSPEGRRRAAPKTRQAAAGRRRCRRWQPPAQQSRAPAGARCAGTLQARGESGMPSNSPLKQLNCVPWLVCSAQVHCTMRERECDGPGSSGSKLLALAWPATLLGGWLDFRTHSRLTAVAQQQGGPAFRHAWHVQHGKRVQNGACNCTTGWERGIRKHVQHGACNWQTGCGNGVVCWCEHATVRMDGRAHGTCAQPKTGTRVSHASCPGAADGVPAWLPPYLSAQCLPAAAV